MFTSHNAPSSGSARRLILAAGCAALVAGASPSAVQGPLPAQQAPAQQAQAQPAQPAQQPPVFRTAANFVRVDVYPTADGRAVQDLAREDFEVFEDGRPQEISSFEHVVIQASAPQETRSEPRTVREAQDMAADPRARLFVLFLDTYHVSRDGAQNVRRALVRMLDGLIAPSDLVAVMTPEMSAGSVTFTRRTGTIEDLLDKWLAWGRRHEELRDPDPQEVRYQSCYPPESGQRVSTTASEMIARRREKLTLDAVRDLIAHLQGLREERKAILMVSEGWALYRPNSSLAGMVDGRVPGVAPIGVGPEGGLRVGDQGRTIGGGAYECDRDRMALAQEDHDREFRDLLDEANRATASFYSIDPRGLPVFDTPVENPSPIVNDQAMLRGRQEVLRTLASATDGLAVMNSNDIDKGLKRIVDDLTSYYLIGYYSPISKADGRFHSITVKVRRPGVQVRARRGYRSPTKDEVEAVTRGEAATRAEPTPAAKAVSALAKIREDVAVHAAAGYEWVPSGSGPAGAVLWIATELDPARASREEQWRAGADVTIAVTGADRSPVGDAKQVLTREAGRAVLRMPVPEKFPGDYSIRITSKPAGATLGSTETLRVVVPRPPSGGFLAGQPLLFRRGPFSGAGWQPAGDLRFRRQERVRVEVAILGSAASAEVKLLDRNGKPLPLPVTTATREEGGRQIVSGEVTLAPLTTGDYVLEVTLPQGQATYKSLAAFRIIP